MNLKYPRINANITLQQLVPMLNPDGVIVGNYRCSLAGLDLNRVWQEPTPRLQPGVAALKALMKAFTAEREVVLFCDLHGHSRKMGIFMYGCEKRAAAKLFGAAAGMAAGAAACATITPLPTEPAAPELPLGTLEKSSCVAVSSASAAAAAATAAATTRIAVVTSPAAGTGGDAAVAAAAAAASPPTPAGSHGGARGVPPRLQERVLPLMLAANAPHLFCYGACSFKVQEAYCDCGGAAAALVH